MLLGDHPADDDSGSHLEIDDFQSNEIRQIFLTTLPDYLEPVRQMVEQLLEGGEGRQVLLETLDKTLASISAAATRIEIHDVATIVERSRARLKRVDEIDDMELRADIFGDLRELEQMASAVSGEAPAAGSSSQTLVAAFSEFKDVDRSALQSLTAAGLVTVEQLKMAERSEVVAVTGLDPSVVDAIMRAIGRTSRSPRRPAPPPVSTATDPLGAALAEKLRAQVEAEVRVDEVRRDILETRTRLRALGDELGAAERRARELAERRDELRTELAKRLASLSAERAERARLERTRVELDQKLRRWHDELERLGRERTSVDDEQRDAAAGIANLVADVERISRAVTQAEHRVTGPRRRGREREP